jgi:NACHT N-terminal Helical domain 7
MRRQFSYPDAVKLLGPVDSKVLAAFERIAGGALLAAAAFGMPQALALLEARTEVAQLGQKLIQGLGEKLSGRARYSRTERLLAAHSVIVVTAFFDALARTEFPFDLTLQRSDQLAITTGQPQGTAGSAWVAALTQGTIPVPTSHVPFEETIRWVTDYYHRLFEQLIGFMQGLAVWDSADATKRNHFIDSESKVVLQRPRSTTSFTGDWRQTAWNSSSGPIFRTTARPEA